MKRHFFNFLALAVLLTAAVSCKKDQPVTGVILDPPTATLTVDEMVTLTATVQPADAANITVRWESSDNNVAAVNNYGKVTAKSEGTATITVTTEEGNYKATCVVTVAPPPHPAEPELVTVQGGTFTMGWLEERDGPEGYDGEKPAHQVTLSSFKIAKYPVTQKQWVALMGSNPSYYQGDDNLPVESVSWNDVQEFIAKLNEVTGKNYRLATEAEWEYAARGGNKSGNFKYSGSNDIDEVAWYLENNERKTHPVGTKKPNELDIYDMTGNVNEFCNDWFAEYTDESQTNPQGPAMGTYRVERGGGLLTAVLQGYRVSCRYGTTPYNRCEGVGFRLVLP